MTLNEARTIRENPAEYSILRLIEALNTVFTELDARESHALDRERVRILDAVRGLA
jgi:hypothetical protein